MNSFYKNKKTAVTGGLGLIGSFLCEELVRAGAKVIVIDDESKGSWRYFPPAVKDKIEFRKKNLLDEKEARQALKGADFVFHLASLTYGVGFSHKNHLEMFRFNDKINTSVLNAILADKPKAALVVSSSCVYPDNGATPMSDLAPLSGEPEAVNYGYGLAKKLLEQKAALYSKESGIPITIVRPFNIYGERYIWVGESSQAIPMLVKRILEGENPLAVWGSGKQSRTYMHASDCARIMMKLVENGFASQPVNIGLEENVSLENLAKTIARKAGVELKMVFDLSKPEGRFIKSADSSLLFKILGEDFPIKVGLEEGMEKMIGWYKDTFNTLNYETSRRKGFGDLRARQGSEHEEFFTRKNPKPEKPPRERVS